MARDDHVRVTRCTMAGENFPMSVAARGKRPNGMMQRQVRQEVYVLLASADLQRVRHIGKSRDELHQLRRVKRRCPCDIVGQLDEEDVGETGFEREFCPADKRYATLLEKIVDRIRAA